MLFDPAFFLYYIFIIAANLKIHMQIFLCRGFFGGSEDSLFIYALLKKRLLLAAAAMVRWCRSATSALVCSSILLDAQQQSRIIMYLA